MITMIYNKLQYDCNDLQPIITMNLQPITRWLNSFTSYYKMLTIIYNQLACGTTWWFKSFATFYNVITYIYNPL